MTQPAPTSPFTTQLPVMDQAALGEVRAMMGDKFTELLSYFLEDSAGYMQQIEEGVATGKAESVVLPAHTLKSSAKQMGAMQLAESARAIELEAREAVKTQGTLESIAPKLEPLREALKEALQAYATLSQVVYDRTS